MNTEQLNEILQPLQPLLDDVTVTEIMIDGADRLLVERRGKLEEAAMPFADAEALASFARQLTAALGRPAGDDLPMVDGRLPDGSLINVVMPPISLMSGPVITIRRFPPRTFDLNNLLEWGSLSQPMLDFLAACIRANLNLAISGGTGSGKTTVLNLLAGLIPAEQRIVTVEQMAEVRLDHQRVVRLEGRPPDANGKGGVTTHDLIVNALKMRPDRIILGEARGPEVLDLFAAMNTGHDGCIFSLHANNPRDVVNRLETMMLMSDLSVPLLTIRQQMVSALHIISHQERMHDGRRRIVKISEVVGMQGDNVELQDIFEFRQTGIEDGQIKGVFTATGYIPKCLRRLHDAGEPLPMSLFTPQ